MDSYLKENMPIKQKREEFSQKLQKQHRENVFQLNRKKFITLSEIPMIVDELVPSLLSQGHTALSRMDQLGSRRELRRVLQSVTQMVGRCEQSMDEITDLGCQVLEKQNDQMFNCHYDACLLLVEISRLCDKCLFKRFNTFILTIQKYSQFIMQQNGYMLIDKLVILLGNLCGDQQIINHLDFNTFIPMLQMLFKLKNKSISQQTVWMLNNLIFTLQFNSTFLQQTMQALVFHKIHEPILKMLSDGGIEVVWLCVELSKYVDITVVCFNGIFNLNTKCPKVLLAWFTMLSNVTSNQKTVEYGDKIVKCLLHLYFSPINYICQREILVSFSNLVVTTPLASQQFIDNAYAKNMIMHSLTTNTLQSEGIILVYNLLDKCQIHDELKKPLWEAMQIHQHSLPTYVVQQINNMFFI